MTEDQKTFLRLAAEAAGKAGHIFPEMAACEAALESSYGRSVLAVLDKNLFGMKQHKHPIYGTHILPTKEFQNGEWITINASWVSYPDWTSCFKDHMSTLQRLATAFPHYASALVAKDGASYVREVSQTWSTDPKRAEKVLAIYDAMVTDWNVTQT